MRAQLAVKSFNLASDEATAESIAEISDMFSLLETALYTTLPLPLVSTSAQKGARVAERTLLAGSGKSTGVNAVLMARDAFVSEM